MGENKCSLRMVQLSLGFRKGKIGGFSYDFGGMGFGFGGRDWYGSYLVVGVQGRYRFVQFGLVQFYQIFFLFWVFIRGRIGVRFGVFLGVLIGIGVLGIIVWGMF